MDVRAEAKRIMAVSISKLYTSRTQRGGMRLHRSLLLSTVIRSARDIYHCAMVNTEDRVVPRTQATEERMDTGEDASTIADASVTLIPEADDIKVAVETKEEDKENLKPTRDSRKRPGRTVVEPDFLPLKKARLETEEEKRRDPGAPLRTSGCWRPVDTLSALSANCAIAAY